MVMMMRFHLLTDSKAKASHQADLRGCYGGSVGDAQALQCARRGTADFLRNLLVQHVPPRTMRKLISLKDSCSPGCYQSGQSSPVPCQSLQGTNHAIAATLGKLYLQAYCSSDTIKACPMQLSVSSSAEVAVDRTKFFTDNAESSSTRPASLQTPHVLLPTLGRCDECLHKGTYSTIAPSLPHLSPALWPAHRCTRVGSCLVLATSLAHSAVVLKKDRAKGPTGSCNFFGPLHF